MKRAENLDPSPELVLAVGFVDTWVLRRAIAFILGPGVGYALLTYAGHQNAGGWLLEVLVAQLPSAPYAVALGLSLSIFDRMRIGKAATAYADLERSRLAVSERPWSFTALRDDWIIRQRYQWKLWPEWAVPMLAGVLVILAAGFIAGVVLCAFLFGTELICWRLLWRRRLLKSGATSTTQRGAPIPGPTRGEDRG
jgi:hypothetical protein